MSSEKKINKKISAKNLKKIWVNFFSTKNHFPLKGAPLIPENDKSILLINSGVAALKEYFLGTKKPPAKNLVTIQKAVRVNDIEEVGKTSHHLTFFEMLGNFSIGGYFKEQAIKLAYEFIFNVLKLDKNKIFITFFHKDKETFKIWKSLGIKSNHLIPGNKETNFWDLGQGPCGPDSEIFFDRGKKYDKKNLGINLIKDNISNERFIEIWNIVFSELNNDGKNNYQELKIKNIDTGAGFERILMILENKRTVFDTSIFRPIIKEIEKLTEEYSYISEEKNNLISEQTKINYSFRLIADHTRTAVVLISDNVMPSNLHRGYVVRKLLRRAYWTGKMLKIKGSKFLFKIVDIISSTLENKDMDVSFVKKIISKEEEIFSDVLKRGQKKLDEMLRRKSTISEVEIFKLFETYGFPIEISKQILRKKGIKINIKKLNLLIKEHAEKSKTHNEKNAFSAKKISVNINKKISSFIGYEKISKKTKIIKTEEKNGQVLVLLEETPFYPGGGGQVHDIGKIDNTKVLSVEKDAFDNIWHIVKEKIKKDNVEAKVNKTFRQKVSKNHSATHLIGAAMRSLYSSDIKQVGSYNDDKKLRIDFEIPSDVEKIDKKEIEALVKKYINANINREYINETFEKAKKMNVIFLNVKKYKDIVRIVRFGKISAELCGGTHVKTTGEIDSFKIINIQSKGTNTIRIIALTSKSEIKKYLNKEYEQLIEQVKKVILNIKKVNPKFEYSTKKINFSNGKQELNKLSEILKNEQKDLEKKVMDVSEENFLNENDKIIYSQDNIPKEIIKRKAIFLRNKYKNSLIILKDVSKKIIVVCSQKYDSLNEMKKRFKNINGGGNKNFAMGSIGKKCEN